VKIRELLLFEGFVGPVIASFRKYDVKLGRMVNFDMKFESEAAAIKYRDQKNIELYHMRTA